MIIGWLLILGALVTLGVAIARRFTPRIELNRKIKVLEKEIQKRDELMVRVLMLCQNYPEEDNPLRVQVLDEIRQDRIGGLGELQGTDRRGRTISGYGRHSHSM